MLQIGSLVATPPSTDASRRTTPIAGSATRSDWCGTRTASRWSLGSWSDIGERKHAEEAVAATQQRIEHLLSTSPAVIYSFRAYGDYGPTFISRNVKDLLGYEREEYLQSPDFWRSRVHPEDMVLISTEN
jgi:PAS domain-containing protein